MAISDIDLSGRDLLSRRLNDGAGGGVFARFDKSAAGADQWFLIRLENAFSTPPRAACGANVFAVYHYEPRFHRVPS